MRRNAPKPKPIFVRCSGVETMASDCGRMQWGASSIRVENRGWGSGKGRTLQAYLTFGTWKRACLETEQHLQTIDFLVSILLHFQGCIYQFGWLVPGQVIVTQEKGNVNMTILSFPTKSDRVSKFLGWHADEATSQKTGIKHRVPYPDSNFFHCIFFSMKRWFIPFSIKIIYPAARLRLPSEVPCLL